MSTIDQAFVQAFARRNRNASQPAPQARSADDGIQVDPSVSGSTQMWIDPAEGAGQRADQASSVRPPKMVPTNTPEIPAVPPHVNQHGHTAYAYAPPQPIVIPSEPTFVAPVELAPVEQAPAAPVPAEPTPIASAPIAPTPVAPAPEPPAAPPAAAPSTPAIEPGSSTIVRRFDQPNTETLQSHWERSPAEPQVEAPVSPAVDNHEAPANVANAIEPIWEVDAFDIPSSVADLFFEEKLFQLVAKRIHDAVNEGLQSLVVTSTKAGEGRSTIAIGMAMAAAASGLNVALVDGDVEDPTLADDLRLDLEFGWVEAARGGLPLSQIAVYSIEDNVTLIPMVPPASNVHGASITEVKKLINELDNQFDLVIIDGPSGDMPLIEQYSAMVDSGIIAWDKSRTDLDTINELSNRMQQAGISGVGIVENFS